MDRLTPVGEKGSAPSVPILIHFSVGYLRVVRCRPLPQPSPVFSGLRLPSVCPLAHRYWIPVLSRSLRSRRRRSFCDCLGRYSHRQAAPLWISPPIASQSIADFSSPRSPSTIVNGSHLEFKSHSTSLSSHRRARTRSANQPSRSPCGIPHGSSASLFSLCVPTPSPLRS